jgi:hypothetical protein
MLAECFQRKKQSQTGPPRAGSFLFKIAVLWLLLLSLLLLRA